ncbi:aminotransferase class V-fold PLP-dependent enzyme [Aliifodinibius sp. S!AR15-10]|uniref:pyridoxal phosphate-dependent decarboxylase family protein n=1 Tax=Aliifodinibius sp. S!AR15-10 TaxID=2950437 RepID=UPI00285C541B|nr:aminotransferase class V-fold PLP-dependent enzyme [Aliifodinibius sp. S!AR15-10]MDR8389946.1 aminotransferase class V-fold PLP-dependent enzyme [Aliifodinibius sp. S!AR15-10]
MDQQLKKLEYEARKLEYRAEEQSNILQKARKYGESFIENISTLPAYVESEDMGRDIYDLPFEEHSKDMDTLLDVLKSEVDTPGLNPASGKHVGYIPGGGLYPSAIADYLAAVTNRYAGVFFSAPGAVRLENMCIRWMNDLVGYPEGASGNLTSGGSIANLIGLVMARDNAEIQAKDFARTVIYTTRQVHHCVMKAIKFAGLDDAIVHNIPMDEQFRMRVEKLEKQIKVDRNEELIPLVIFASAGTTDLGAVDPINAIADISEKESIWYHVDAAYGGFFLLTEHGEKKLAGIERADSITIDPHKGLFLPYGSGALLVKEGEKLYKSQHMTAHYMQDAYKATEEVSPADLSPELSKHFRGLRMWLPLQLFGIKPFRAALKEKLLLTRYFYQEVQKISGIEVGPEPELSVMYFRYIPGEGDPDQFNKRLVDEIHRDGRVFLSSTHLKERFYLRVAVLNFRTHREEVDLILSILREKIKKITEMGSFSE